MIQLSRSFQEIIFGMENRFKLIHETYKIHNSDGTFITEGKDFRTVPKTIHTIRFEGSSILYPEEAISNLRAKAWVYFGLLPPFKAFTSVINATCFGAAVFSRYVQKNEFSKEDMKKMTQQGIQFLKDALIFGSLSLFLNSLHSSVGEVPLIGTSFSIWAVSVIAMSVLSKALPSPNLVFTTYMEDLLFPPIIQKGEENSFIEFLRAMRLSSFIGIQSLGSQTEELPNGSKKEKKVLKFILVNQEK